MKRVSKVARVIAAVLTAVFLVSGAWEQVLSAAGGSVPEEHWGSALLREALVRGLLRGYPDGTIRPDADITRAEFAALLVRSFFGDAVLGSVRGVSRFSDVDVNHWAKPYLETCGEMGILVGYGYGCVIPDKGISRAEAATMVDRALSVSGLRLSEAEARFGDVSEIPDWAAGPIRRLFGARILQGDDSGALRPGAPLTRAEAVALLLKGLDMLGRRWDVEGEVVQVDPQKRQLMLLCQGEAVTLAGIDEDTYVYRANSPTGLGAITSGECVRVVFKRGSNKPGVIILGNPKTGD
ncbi:MAG TPA: S-layer homology domain-containing protein [Firmicutes bacterium]|nr:S-layer homology domain-containing protein [Candidatus Fermentithermobacillaceae bacterium]